MSATIRYVKRHRQESGLSFCDLIPQQQTPQGWVDIDLVSLKAEAEWESKEDERGYENGHARDCLAFEMRYPIDEDNEVDDEFNYNHPCNNCIPENVS